MNENNDVQQLYEFKLPIGDWSADGHGKCEYFLVHSAKPVAYVREVHYTIKDKTGVDIHNLCDEYGVDFIRKADPEYQLLKDMGFDWTSITDMENHLQEIHLSPEDMAELWVFLLNYCDEDLDLRIINDPIPWLPFYGHDDKDRHIEFVGYGVFSD